MQKDLSEWIKVSSVEVNEKIAKLIDKPLTEE